MEAEPVAAQPPATAADDTGGMDNAPALKTEPGADPAQEPAVAAAAPTDAAETVAGAADGVVKAEEGAAQDGAEEEGEAPGLPPLPSTVQLLQESCGWTVNGRIEVRVPSVVAVKAEGCVWTMVRACSAASKSRLEIEVVAFHGGLQRGAEAGLNEP